MSSTAESLHALREQRVECRRLPAARPISTRSRRGSTPTVQGLRTGPVTTAAGSPAPPRVALGPDPPVGAVHEPTSTRQPAPVSVATNSTTLPERADASSGIQPHITSTAWSTAPAATSGAIALTGTPAASSASTLCMVASYVCMRRVNPTVWSEGHHDQHGSSSFRSVSSLHSFAVASARSVRMSEISDGRAGFAASTAGSPASVNTFCARMPAQK